MRLSCNTGYSYSTKNSFQLSPLKEGKLFAYKGIAVTNVGRTISEDFSIKEMFSLVSFLSCGMFLLTSEV